MAHALHFGCSRCASARWRCFLSPTAGGVRPAPRSSAPPRRLYNLIIPSMASAELESHLRCQIPPLSAAGAPRRASVHARRATSAPGRAHASHQQNTNQHGCAVDAVGAAAIHMAAQSNCVDALESLLATAGPHKDKVRWARPHTHPRACKHSGASLCRHRRRCCSSTQPSAGFAWSCRRCSPGAQQTR